MIVKSSASWLVSTRSTSPAGIATACRSRTPSKKLHGRNLSRDDMQAKSRAYATEQIDQQRRDFKRLGVLGDWEPLQETMNPANEAGQIRAFKRVIERGFVYRGLKPVYWCFDCGSSWPSLRSNTPTRRATRWTWPSRPTTRPRWPVRSVCLAPGDGNKRLCGDLDHHRLDHPRQPGAQRPPSWNTPGSTRRAACCVLAASLVESAWSVSGSKARHRHRQG